jgi:hypothetical protein
MRSEVLVLCVLLVILILMHVEHPHRSPCAMIEEDDQLAVIPRMGGAEPLTDQKDHVMPKHWSVMSHIGPKTHENFQQSPRTGLQNLSIIENSRMSQVSRIGGQA